MSSGYTELMKTLKCVRIAYRFLICVYGLSILIKHSMNTIVEVLIFAIARGLVVGHEKPLEVLIQIACIAILLVCRKFLFHDFDFQEEE